MALKCCFLGVDVTIFIPFVNGEIFKKSFVTPDRRIGFVIYVSVFEVLENIIGCIISSDKTILILQNIFSIVCKVKNVKKSQILNINFILGTYNLTAIFKNMTTF
jgi:hypothetical protein